MFLQKRIIALALLACFVSVSLLSAVFVFTHANHVHDHLGAGGGCATCAQIQIAESLLLQSGVSAGNGAFAFISLLSALAAICLISLFGFQTLIKLKARMNN